MTSSRSQPTASRRSRRTATSIAPAPHAASTARSPHALYRTAQEALTNVTRHSAAERVEVRLAYEPAGTRLVVRDFGPGAPVAVGAAGGGYGLTSMRERAELLGGELAAGPTDDGFRVEMWLAAQ